MRCARLSRLIRFASLLICCFPGAAPAQEYRSYSEVEKLLTDWSKQHAALVQLESIGQSPGGRRIHAVRIAAAGEVDPSSRPAVFVGANMAGFHNAGTEAALHLIERLLTDAASADLLKRRTFYVAPVLNPDAHDGMFAKVRRRLSGHAKPIDRDMDGLAGEDGPDDLNGDGRITQMRIADPAGTMLPDPADPRRMIAADPAKGQRGLYRVFAEGRDEDGDGEYNEDPPDGIQPARNFAHAFPHGQPEAGLFPSHAPESKAIMDYLLKRRNVAFAYVFGPANNFLSAPRSVGGGADLSSAKIKPPRQFAGMLGLDPDQEYSLDDIWEAAKDLPMVRAQNLTKEQLAQFLGGGPATVPAQDDLKLMAALGEEYKKRLKAAGLDDQRAGQQYQAGGFTPWLYYQYGAMAVELDVWGVPKAKPAGGPPQEGALTIEALEKMSAAEFEALPDERLAAFLKANNAPAMATPAMLKGMVKSGNVTPAQMVARMRQMGINPAAPAAAGADDLMAWIDANAPSAFVAWTPVVLPDGVNAEVGGVDPFIEIAPPRRFLAPALEVHTQTVLETAKQLAEIEIVDVSAEALSAGVWRVKGAARNRGYLPTHTQHATRARTYLPVRLEVGLPQAARLLNGRPFSVSERLAGSTGTLEGEWVVQAPPGTEIRLTATSDQAGSATVSHRLGGQN